MTSQNFSRTALTAALFLMIMASGCKKEPEPFISSIEVTATFGKDTYDRPIMTLEDSLRLIHKESLRKTFYTSYLSEAEYRKQMKRTKSRGVLIDGIYFRWPNGKIPYRVASNQPGWFQLLIAFISINCETNMKAVPRNREEDYIQFPITDLLQLVIGSQGGQQEINVREVAGMEYAADEILHMAGMLYEQSNC